MANHSAEAPAGQLTYDVLQSWFGIEGTTGNYKATQGAERIPEKWVCYTSVRYVRLHANKCSTVEPSLILTIHHTSWLMH